MSSPEAIAAVCEVGEGPHWDAGRRRWSWTDNANGRLFWLDGPDLSILRPGVDVVGAVPKSAGGWLLPAYDGLYDFDDNAIARFGAPAARTRFNDGKCDALGRFWVGTMSVTGQAGQGALYRVAETVTAMASGFDVCNGIGFSLDNRWLYLVDTGQRLVYRYGFDLAAGMLGDRTVLFHFPPKMGKPDGMAVAEDGSLWFAMWDGACLVRLTPDGGLIETLPLPVLRPTSLAFGAGDMLITTARKGVSEADLLRYPLSGQPLLLPSSIGGAPVYDFAF